MGGASGGTVTVPTSITRWDSTSRPWSRICLDHAAGTPMYPEAVAAMTSQLTRYGNPSSLHSSGRAARRLVEESRESIAVVLNARPSVGQVPVDFAASVRRRADNQCPQVGGSTRRGNAGCPSPASGHSLDVSLFGRSPAAESRPARHGAPRRPGTKLSTHPGPHLEADVDSFVRVIGAVVERARTSGGLARTAERRPARRRLGSRATA